MNIHHLDRELIILKRFTTQINPFVEQEDKNRPKNKFPAAEGDSPIPFFLRKNRDSPQVIFRPILSRFPADGQPVKMPLLQLKDVHKTYQLGQLEVQALKNISLDIEGGEYVALMGPSGSGKSTLMNTLGCLDRPTRGSYLFDGEEVASMSLDQRARLRNHKIGFVFQNFNLLPRSSALENVELPILYSSRYRGRRRRERARFLLEKVGLTERREHRPAQLSGGEQQRVAVARALANEPAVLLADEPTGNLDSHTGQDVIKLFGQLNQEDGITIILVTHDAEVARHARRTVLLHDGEIVRDSLK
jgi:putative ABC transport system ATP-binding protein